MVRASSERRRSYAVVYDALVKGLVVYLSVVLFLPFNCIALFFNECSDLDISQGSMGNLDNSGYFLSHMVADAFMVLRSIVKTAEKHGNSPFSAIVALF